VALSKSSTSGPVAGRYEPQAIMYPRVSGHVSVSTKALAIPMTPVWVERLALKVDDVPSESTVAILMPPAFFDVGAGSIVNVLATGRTVPQPSTGVGYIVYEVSKYVPSVRVVPVGSDGVAPDVVGVTSELHDAVRL
jgi:hypothetical protein